MASSSDGRFKKSQGDLPMKVFLGWMVICLFSTFFTIAAFAQTDRGTITGTVSDMTGAVVPGTRVEAKNVQTGSTYTAGSSETGNYTLPQLPAGVYEVSISLPGFTE